MRWWRGNRLVVLLLVGSMFEPQTALAADDPTASFYGDCRYSRIAGRVVCPWEYRQRVPGGAGSSGGGGGGASSQYRWEGHPRIVTPPDGGPACIAMLYRRVPADQPPISNVWGPNTGFVGPDGTAYHPCPPRIQTEGHRASEVAVQGWESVDLPAPSPRIQPGWAITGKWAYLETRNQTTFTFEKDTEVGRLTIVATGTYYVDWGDGNTTGPHSMEGRPWPDGVIRHQYTHVGRYDVVATERWVADWYLGPWSGRLHQLETSGRIDDFEVRQIQAVVISG